MRLAAWLAFALSIVPALASGQVLISTGAASGLRLYYPAGNDWWLDPSAGRLDFRANGGSAMASLLSTGQLGIGTTNPGNILQIKGVSDTTAYIVAQLTGGSSGYGAQLQFSDGFNYNFAIGTKNDATGDFTFNAGRYNGNAGTEVLRVKQDGTVGIGTTSPFSTMTVVGALGLGGISQPGGTAAGRGVVYFDSTSHKFMASENGGSFTSLLSPFKIVQIVQSFVNASSTTASTTMVDTGLYATITPTSVNSKIFIFVWGNLLINSPTVNDNAISAIYRGSTDITSGTDRSLKVLSQISSVALQLPCAYIHLDSPNTTSPTQYKLRIRTDSATGGLAGWGSSGGTGLASEMILVEVSQ